MLLDGTQIIFIFSARLGTHSRFIGEVHPRFHVHAGESVNVFSSSSSCRDEWESGGSQLLLLGGQPVFSQFWYSIEESECSCIHSFDTPFMSLNARAFTDLILHLGVWMQDFCHCVCLAVIHPVLLFFRVLRAVGYNWLPQCSTYCYLYLSLRIIFLLCHYIFFWIVSAPQCVFEYWELLATIDFNNARFIAISLWE
jgi:hypothetical protein